MARTKNGRRPDTWDALMPAHYPPGTQPAVEQDARGGRLLKNRTHTVAVTPLDPTRGEAGWVHLSIKRNDRAAVRDWRIMQRIKNEVIGPEREAVELYPAESRLVDESNQFHLFVAPEGVILDIGFDQRVVGTPERAAAVGARQRAFDGPVEGLDEHQGDTIRIRLPSSVRGSR